MSERRPAKRFAIIGGGASGALMAAALLRDRPQGVSVTIIEKRAHVGRGLAYATDNPSHLLNVRAANMSAFADDPDHFWRWLVAEGHVAEPGADRFRFVPRGVYGRYLESLLAERLSDAQALNVVRDTARAVSETPDGVTIALQAGPPVRADLAILACGHENVADEGPLMLSPWAEPLGGGGVADDAAILVLGTGLTMVDVATALRARGHRGRIVALSRRGLTPQAHRPVEPLPIDAGAAPFGRDIATICHWLRALARGEEARSGDWRSVVDGLRPHTQAIWRLMAPGQRRRFLEHARPWWDSHRHRMAPEIALRLQALLDSRQLTIIAGKVVEIRADGAGARVALRRRGTDAIEYLDVARIISCKGVTSNPPSAVNPLVDSLFAAGRARVDTLGVGIDVAADCAIIDRDGRASRRLFAIGPMSQAAFWEITAVPDIRLQTAQLAARLLALAVEPASGSG